MDQVFAPWRIEWVERETHNPDAECIFCTFAESVDDRANRVVARNEHAFVLLNNYPYAPGHAMVIPHAHVDDPRDLDEATLLDRDRLVGHTLDALEATMDPDGFNTGANLGGSAAGGSIDDHVHTHVVPRWAGDTNFMAVVADTTVIVEGLEDSYERLHDAFADLDGATVPGPERAVHVE